MREGGRYRHQGLLFVPNEGEGRRGRGKERESRGSKEER